VRLLTEQQAQLVDLLRCRRWTIGELAAEVGMHQETVQGALRRARAAGIPVQALAPDDMGPRKRGNQPRLWTVAWPKGRVCAAEGCGTILRTTNPSTLCERHGGGCITDDMLKAPPPLLQRARRCTDCGCLTRDMRPDMSRCRLCYNASRSTRRKDKETA